MWPSSTMCSSARRMSADKILALMSGTIGSSEPCMTSVGCGSSRSQGGKAGPSGGRDQLIEVAAVTRRPQGLGVPAQQVRIGSKGAAIDLSAEGVQKVRIDVSPRAHELGEHARSAGNHQSAGRSRRQHQLATLRRELKRERLRERATPRHPKRIDRAVVSELAEKPLREPGKAGKTIRQQRGRRAARAGNVERNDLAL